MALGKLIPVQPSESLKVAAFVELYEPFSLEGVRLSRWLYGNLALRSGTVFGHDTFE